MPQPNVDVGAQPNRAQGNTEEARTGSVDYIISEILRGLYEGRYVPGQKLAESALTRKFGVGRGSVREAMRRLEAEGLVTASLHRGASIRSFSRKSVRDVLEVIENLATFAARLAADRLVDPKQTGPVRETVEGMAAHLEARNSYETSRIRYRFFRELVALTGNGELAHLLPRYDVSVIRAQFRTAFESLDAKKEIEVLMRAVDAIEAKDSENAVLGMREYVRLTAAVIQKLPDHYFDNHNRP